MFCAARVACMGKRSRALLLCMVSAGLASVSEAPEAVMPLSNAAVRPSRASPVAQQAGCAPRKIEEGIAAECARGFVRQASNSESQPDSLHELAVLEFPSMRRRELPWPSVVCVWVCKVL